MKEGEILRLKIRGSGNTVEQAAILVGLARKTLYNYFKQDVLEDSIKDLFFEKLKLDFAQIDTIRVQNEHTETISFKNKGNKNTANENIVHEKSYASESTITILAESNKLLAENNRLLLEANQRLTKQAVAVTEDELLGIPLRMMPRFVTLLKLLAKAGATGWKTEVEALAEISNTFYADLYSKKAEGILRH